ncbi:MAG: hypothetical protein ACLTW9_05580 [Enterocloster sp.]
MRGYRVRKVNIGTAPRVASDKGPRGQNWKTGPNDDVREQTF